MAEDDVKGLDEWTIAGCLETLERRAGQVKELIEQHAAWLLVGITLVYSAWTALLASRRLLWNDELFTYYIAMLPRATDIWPALMSGGEQIPPFFHLLTRVVLQQLGVSHLSIRLPEMVGFLVMMLCLFRFVARRSSAFYGLLAMLFPLVTGAYPYAYEGRPYGLVLGFSGLALISWQAAADNSHRRLALVLLSVSLAGALSSHYYAILVFFALGVGEVARSLSRRRLDLPVWIAFGVAAVVPLAIFSPLIVQARTYAGTFWNPLHRGQILQFYRELLRPAAMPLVATLLLALAYAMLRPAPRGHEPRPTPPVHEIAVAFGFALLPPVAFVVAALVTNAFVGRYVLPTVIGFSILVAFALHGMPRGRALIGTALLLVLSGWFVLGQQETLRKTRAAAGDRWAEIRFLQDAAGPDLPIVASEPHIFMSLAYYGTPGLTARLVYLGDPEASLRRLGHDTVDRAMVELIGPWFRLPVRDYRSFVESHPRFWLYGNLGWLNWVMDELRADNRRLELKHRRGGNFLFLVTRPE